MCWSKASLALETPPAKDDATNPYEHVWAHGVSSASDWECIIDQNGNFLPEEWRFRQFMCYYRMAAASRDTSSKRRCSWLLWTLPTMWCSHGGWWISILLTIGAGTGCIMMHSRVGCCSSLGTEKKRGKQSKSCIKKKLARKCNCHRTGRTRAICTLLNCLYNMQYMKAHHSFTKVHLSIFQWDLSAECLKQ